MIRALVLAILVIGSICILLTAKAQAHPAWGIAVDPQGQVYFSDLQTIWKIAVQGKLSVFRAAKDGRHTHEMNIDEAGNVYGEDDFKAIWKITPAGDFSYIQAPTDNPPRGVSIWRDRDGNMYSVEQNNHLKRETLLLRRKPSGNVSVFAGGNYGHADGKGRRAKFSNIVGITFGADNSLYLVDGSGIRKVTMDGAVTTLIRNVKVENASGNSAGSSSLFGIAVDAQGNVFVADYGNRRILKIAPNGQMTTLLRSEESWYPTGVAARGGEIYILEEAHTPTYKPIGTRVRKLSSDGKNSVLATVGENTNPPTDTTPVSTNIKSSVVAPKKFSSYWLVGIGASVFALSIVVWRIRKKKSVELSKRKTYI
jgi:hypothetical protein